MIWPSDSSIIAVLCSIWIGIDILGGHPQKMKVMNIVWPVTALYSGLLGLWAYYRFGRRTPNHAVRNDNQKKTGEMKTNRPFWQSVALAASHCGGGCTLGDILSAALLLAFPFAIFGRKIFADWAVGYVLAFIIGIVFQYFTIKPMRHLSPGEGLKAAVKADALSLTSWQIGMYGWMAIAVFVLFGHELPKTSPVFWFMMQIAMLIGFLTSYPVNWWLVRKGIKEKM